MPFLLLTAVVLAQAAPEPALELTHGGLEVTQYFSVNGEERYAGGVTPRHVPGLDVSYTDTLEHTGASSLVTAKLHAAVEGELVSVDLTLKAALQKPAKRFPGSGFGAAAPQAFVVLRVDAKKTQGLVVTLDGTMSPSDRDAEARVDLLVDAREVAVLRTKKDLGRRLTLPLTPGPHEVWLKAHAEARLPPKGRALSAAVATKVALRLRLDEVPQAAAPAPVDCVEKPLRFPSPGFTGGAMRATHVFPNDPTLGSVQALTPAFLLRVDRDVTPEALLEDLMVTDGSWGSWRKPALKVRGCFKEREGERAWTTVVFQPVTPFAGWQDSVQWHLRTGDPMKPLGPQTVQPLTRAQGSGLTQVGGMMITTARGLPAGAPFEPDGVGLLLDQTKLEPATVWAELENDAEALALLRDWAGVDVTAAMAVMKRHREALEKRIGPDQRLEVPYVPEGAAPAPVRREVRAPDRPSSPGRPPGR